jgi:chromosome segregation ATPase
MNELTTTLIIALSGSLIGGIPGILAFIRGRKSDKIDHAEKLTGTALQMVKALESRIDGLEYRNSDLEQTVSLGTEWRLIAKEEISDLKNALEDEIEKRRQLEQTVTQLEQENVKLKDEMTKLKQERDELLSDNRTLLTRIRLLEDKNRK